MDDYNIKGDAATLLLAGKGSYLLLDDGSLATSLCGGETGKAGASTRKYRTLL